jgi:hypothetical protein
MSADYFHDIRDMHKQSKATWTTLTVLTSFIILLAKVDVRIDYVHNRWLIFDVPKRIFMRFIP